MRAGRSGKEAICMCMLGIAIVKRFEVCTRIIYVLRMMQRQLREVGYRFINNYATLN